MKKENRNRHPPLPLLKNWNYVYAFVLGFLIFTIAMIYLFSEFYQ